jgi:hypothetical protein
MRLNKYLIVGAILAVIGFAALGRATADVRTDDTRARGEVELVGGLAVGVTGAITYYVGKTKRAAPRSYQDVEVLAEYSKQQHNHKGGKTNG